MIMRRCFVESPLQVRSDPGSYSRFDFGTEICPYRLADSKLIADLSVYRLDLQNQRAMIEIFFAGRRQGGKKFVHPLSERQAKA